MAPVQRVACIVTVIVALLSASQVARAHSSPAQRSVVAQLEHDRVVVLVTWTAPTGFLTPLMMASAALLSPKTPKTRLRSFMAAHALAPIEIRVGAKKLEAAVIKRKLTLDSGPRRRHTVSLLVEYLLPARGTFKIASTSPEPTRLAWTRKEASSERGAEVVKASRLPGRWGAEAIELSYR